MFTTLSALRKVVSPTVSRTYAACSVRLASEREKTKPQNVLSFDSLFPRDETVKTAADEPSSLNLVNQNSFFEPIEVSNDPREIGVDPNEDEDCDAFGTLASPETRKKLEKLEGLWPLTGWNDDLEEEEGVETKREDGVALIASERSKQLPTVVTNEEDEVLKPSLLYPGDSARRALSRGRRTSVQTWDGIERRDHGYFQSKIDKLIGRGYVREALQLHEIGMKLEVGIEPDFYLYKSLIKGCSKIGDAVRALSFYRRMRERGDSFDGDTYTQLFNACINCDPSAKGLEIASQIWADLRDDDFHFVSSGKNRKKEQERRILYYLYMKVLLRSGLADRVFELYDEMSAKNIAPDFLTPVLLLQACYQDRENGFAKALLYWKSFRSDFPAAPLTVAHYDRLIKAAFNAGVERPDLFMPLLNPKRHEVVSLAETVTYLERMSLPKSVETPLRLEIEKRASTRGLLLESASPEPRSLEDDTRFLTQPNGKHLSSPSPSLLTSLPTPPRTPSTNDSSETVAPLSTAHDRLALIGGPEKIVERMMQSEKTLPTSKIFIPLLRCASKEEDVVKRHLSLMDRVGMRPDEEWITAAVGLEAARAKENGDWTRAWRLIRVAETRGIPLHPRVFKTLSYYVKTDENFEKFASALRDSRVEPNVDDFTRIFKFCGDHNFGLKILVFKSMTEEFLLRPGDEFRRWLEAKLKIRPDKNHQKEFIKLYKKWLRRNDLKWGD